MKFILKLGLVANAVVFGMFIHEFIFSFDTITWLDYAMALINGGIVAALLGWSD